jgi:N-acetylmuramoyl-L-alanine amidase
MTRRPRQLRNVGLSTRLPPVTEGPAMPRIYGPGDSARPLIVIDPGHGGHDPGARNAASGAMEKDVTLAVAAALKDELLKSGRLRVALTREDDRFLALEERFGLAQDMGAALFISIHADASEETGAHGATVYTLSDVASDAEAERLAARENRANILDGVDLTGKSSAVSSILIDLTQRETMTASSRFAELLHRETASQVAFRTPWHRRASLVVLKSPDTPSVLFETGYISNDEEAARLGTGEGRERLVRGVAQAIAIYAATLDKSGPKPTPPR